MSGQIYNVKDLKALLGVSDSKAYEYIRQMNKELSDGGYLIVRGKVPAAYVQKRFFGVSPDGE